MRQIDVVPAKPALGQHRRDIGRQTARAFGCRIDHHAGKPRRQREAAQSLPFLGDAPTIERAEFGQQRTCFAECAFRRRIICPRPCCDERIRWVSPLPSATSSIAMRI